MYFKESIQLLNLHSYFVTILKGKTYTFTWQFLSLETSFGNRSEKFKKVHISRNRQVVTITKAFLKIL